MNDTPEVRKKKSIYPLLLGERLRERLNEMAAYYEKSVAETIRDAVNFMYLEKYMKNARGYGKGTEPTVPRETKLEKWNALEALPDNELNVELDKMHAFDAYKSTLDTKVFVARDQFGDRIIRYVSSSEDSVGSFFNFFNEIKKTKSI